VRELVLQSLDRQPVTGLAVAVRGYDFEYVDAFGLANAEIEVPARPSTLFRIGSITKTVTALMVGRLVDDGTLELDRPLAETIPEIRCELADVTLRRLLCHTSGLPSGGQAEEGRPAHNEDLASFVRDVLPRYPLGTRGEYQYSNPGYAVTGYVAERATGTPYRELVQSLVLDPLEMASATFEPSRALTYSVAASHADDGTVEHRPFDYPGRWPAGFLFASAPEVLALGEAISVPGRLVSAETLAEMTHPHAEATEERRYGLGVFIEDRDGRRRVGHTGHIMNYASRLDVAPEDGVTCVLLFNQATFRDEARALADLLIRKAAEASPRPVHDGASATRG